MAFGIALPSALPAVPLVNGYQTQPQSNQVTFQPEIGEAKTRRRGTARVKPLAASFYYTTAQVAIFEAWFEDDLKDGSLRMAWTDPMRGDLADWKFDPENPYTIAALSNAVGMWTVTWQVARLP